MPVIRDLSKLVGARAAVVALGNFDGVHLGHQALLQAARERARTIGGAAYALTFDPLPAKILAPDRAPRLLMTSDNRFDLLQHSGLDGVIVLEFTIALSRVTPAEFAAQFLRERIGAHTVVVGHNVSFGHNRAGDAATMSALGRKLGFDTIVVGPVRLDSHEVSSSEIRDAITAGDLRAAAAMLGRPHFLSGPVIHGRERGRTIGFPTANLGVRTECLPPDGVYATRIVIDGERFPSITNIGMRPTFAEPERTFEAHIFDFDRDIYDREVRLELLERIRPERKFASGAELAAQIKADLAQARAILELS